MLPVPYAFSRLGVLPGLGVALSVALANALTGTLVLRCAGALDAHSLEGLAGAAGGPAWKVRCRNHYVTVAVAAPSSAHWYFTGDPAHPPASHRARRPCSCRSWCAKSAWWCFCLATWRATTACWPTSASSLCSSCCRRAPCPDG